MSDNPAPRPKMLAEFDLTIRTALGLHEAMRRLNVPAADIFVWFDGGKFTVILGPAGFVAGPLSGTDAEVGQLWHDAAKTWNAAPSAHQQALFAEFQARVEPVPLILGIQRALALVRQPVH